MEIQGEIVDNITFSQNNKTSHYWVGWINHSGSNESAMLIPQCTNSVIQHIKNQNQKKKLLKKTFCKHDPHPCPCQMLQQRKSNPVTLEEKKKLNRNGSSRNVQNPISRYQKSPLVLASNNMLIVFLPFTVQRILQQSVQLQSSGMHYMKIKMSQKK